jgi:hypothetical protein
MTAHLTHQPQEGPMFSIETLFTLGALLALDTVILWTGRKRKVR